MATLSSSHHDWERFGYLRGRGEKGWTGSREKVGVETGASYTEVNKEIIELGLQANRWLYRYRNVVDSREKMLQLLYPNLLQLSFYTNN